MTPNGVLEQPNDPSKLLHRSLRTTYNSEMRSDYLIILGLDKSG